MKRMFGVLMMAFATLMLGAGVALAQSTYPPEPNATTSVLGDGGSDGGATAFTGGDVSVLAIVVVALLAAGLVALFVARRRAAHASAA